MLGVPVVAAGAAVSAADPAATAETSGGSVLPTAAAGGMAEVPAVAARAAASSDVPIPDESILAEYQYYVRSRFNIVRCHGYVFNWSAGRVTCFL